MSQARIEYPVTLEKRNGGLKQPDNPMFGAQLLGRIPLYGQKQELGDIKSGKVNLNSLLINLLTYEVCTTPSMIGRTISFQRTQKKEETAEYLRKFSLQLLCDHFVAHPYQGLLVIIGPPFRKDKNGWNPVDAGLFFLTAPNWLVRATTILAEAAFRGLGTLLMKPINYSYNEFQKARTEGNKLKMFGWGVAMGLSLIPAFLAQPCLFAGRTCAHIRVAVDSILTFPGSVVESAQKFFKDKSYANRGLKETYTSTYPTPKVCAVSFLKNLPNLIFDAIVIGACLIPGGQFVPAAVPVIGPALAPWLTPIGNAIGGFFAAAKAAFGTIAAATIVGGTTSLAQNLLTFGVEEISKRNSVRIGKIEERLKDQRDNAAARIREKEERDRAAARRAREHQNKKGNQLSPNEPNTTYLTSKLKNNESKMPAPSFSDSKEVKVEASPTKVGGPEPESPIVLPSSPDSCSDDAALTRSRAASEPIATLSSVPPRLEHKVEPENKLDNPTGGRRFSL